MSNFDRELLAAVAKAVSADQSIGRDCDTGDKVVGTSVLLEFNTPEEAQRFTDYLSAHQAEQCPKEDIENYKSLRANAEIANTVASEARAKLPLSVRRAIDKGRK